MDIGQIRSSGRQLSDIVNTSAMHINEGVYIIQNTIVRERECLQEEKGDLG